MKKRIKRLISVCMTLTIIFGAAVNVPAAATDQASDSIPTAGSVSNENTPDEDAPQETAPVSNSDAVPADQTQKEPEGQKEPENSNTSNGTSTPESGPSEPQNPEPAPETGQKEPETNAEDIKTRIFPVLLPQIIIRIFLVRLQ